MTEASHSEDVETEFRRWRRENPIFEKESLGFRDLEDLFSSVIFHEPHHSCMSRASVDTYTKVEACILSS